MAKRKRKSVKSTSAKDVEAIEALDETSRATSTHPPPQTSSRRRTKGSVEFIEISSDEEERQKQPRLSGMLRGLNPSNMFSPTQVTTEVKDEDYEGDDDDKKKIATQHGTRQSRFGRSEANYDMKYHPMDDVTRPKRAAQRRSTSIVATHDAETDEESLPSSAMDSDAESDIDEESSNEPEILRLPDPKATRHSKRETVNKNVNYSRKHHPQDHSLPGHQHKARMAKNALKQAKEETPRSVSPEREQSESPASLIVLIESADGDLATGEEPHEPDREKSSPRKKLRSLEDGRIWKAARKNEKSRKETSDETSGGLHEMVGLLNDVAAELDKDIENAVGTKLASTQTNAIPPEDNSEQRYEEDAFMFMDQRDPSADQDIQNGNDANPGTADAQQIIAVSALLQEESATVPSPPLSKSGADIDHGFSSSSPKAIVSEHEPTSQFNDEFAVTEKKDSSHMITPTSERDQAVPPIDRSQLSSQRLSDHESPVADGGISSHSDAPSEFNFEKHVASGRERNSSDSGKNRTPEKTAADEPQSEDLVDTLLQDYRSSQRPRSDMLVASDPTESEDRDEMLQSGYAGTSS